MPFTIPVGPLAACIAVATLGGMLAGLLPGRRAARMNVLDAVTQPRKYANAAPAPSRRGRSIVSQPDSTLFRGRARSPDAKRLLGAGTVGLE